ncbi:hypothetical protein GIB67_018633 [Kingdonia uniflora]|uniref:Small nuclear ribonucleoprotein E n=1 Tax=Kingdonia uniflora TaxID=39325 RepID=A0A7J7M2F0_9MAGN|nr:hypothetical protein GIB67_018633 [Kingdonia uniflora]
MTMVSAPADQQLLPLPLVSRGNGRGRLGFTIAFGWGFSLGFDEYMNLVLDDAEEVNIKKKTKKPLGRILLKGDNITLMQNTFPAASEDKFAKVV